MELVISHETQVHTHSELKERKAVNTDAVRQRSDLAIASSTDQDRVIVRFRRFTQRVKVRISGVSLIR